MNEFIGGFSIGLMIGLAIAAVSVINIDVGNAPARKAESKSKALIAMCESTLPRNESCELIARKKGV